MVDEQTGLTVDRSVLQYHLIQNGTRIILMGMKCGTVLGLGICTYFSVAAPAGKFTDAQITILIGYLTETRGGATVTAALLFGTIGMLFGFLQWRLRRRVIAAFDNYRTAAEGPNRSSSMLDRYGQTHPRDR